MSTQVKAQEKYLDQSTKTNLKSSAIKRHSSSLRTTKICLGTKSSRYCRINSSFGRTRRNVLLLVKDYGLLYSEIKAYLHLLKPPLTVFRIPSPSLRGAETSPWKIYFWQLKIRTTPHPSTCGTSRRSRARRRRCSSQVLKKGWILTWLITISCKMWQTEKVMVYINRSKDPKNKLIGVRHPMSNAYKKRTMLWGLLEQFEVTVEVVRATNKWINEEITIIGLEAFLEDAHASYSDSKSMPVYSTEVCKNCDRSGHIRIIGTPNQTERSTAIKGVLSTGKATEVPK